MSKLLICGLAALAMTTTGCFRAQARMAPEMPPLEVPMPPPRMVDATEPEPPPQIGIVEDLSRTPTVRPRPAAPVTQTAPARPEPPRQEPRVEPPPVEPVKAVEEPPRAQPTLQTTRTDRESEVEANIRRLMTSATNDLNRINYTRLNADAKGQYESVKAFLRQAEEALRVRNLVFGQTVADKAAQLAGQLAGRR